MPTICQFGGIRIVMFLRGKDHNPPHIHAFYQDFDASFEISTGELLSGTFPAKSKAQVKKFILQYQKELEGRISYCMATHTHLKVVSAI